MSEKLKIKKRKLKVNNENIFVSILFSLGGAYLYLVSARAPTLINSISCGLCYTIIVFTIN